MTELESFPDSDSAMLELLNKLNQGADWAVLQSNALAVDIIAWGEASAKFWLFVCLILAMVGTLLTVYLYVKMREDDTAATFGIVFCFLTCLCTVGVLGNAYDLYKIKTAPRLYLAEEIVDMIGHSRGKK